MKNRIKKVILASSIFVKMISRNSLKANMNFFAYLLQIGFRKQWTYPDSSRISSAGLMSGFPTNTFFFTEAIFCLEHRCLWVLFRKSGAIIRIYAAMESKAYFVSFLWIFLQSFILNYFFPKNMTKIQKERPQCYWKYSWKAWHHNTVCKP